MVSYRGQDRCLRLRFDYEHGEIAVVDRSEVEMRALPSENLESLNPADRTGFWFEVRDRQGKLLYRRGMRAPMLRTSETSDSDGTRRVRPAVPARGSFSVLVPDLPAGAELVLFASPMGRGRLLRPATEMLRVPLSPPRPGGPPRQNPAGV